MDCKKIGLLIGIEIHQQLLTSKKLFCNCDNCDDYNVYKKISRKLRISKGELGHYDQSSLFEKTKSKTISYLATKNSCLVEEDEEPPHDLNPDAKHVALIIANNLNSHIFSETYVMRKMVIDGSNTSGFQRTILISSGGNIKINNQDIKIQTICLEEDSARIITDKTKEYSLDRLGIPLIEIALAPICASPAEIKKISFDVGMMLRTTKKVKRGLGTIRQDVNVSIKGGSIVEIKGIQNLDQLEKAINYEIQRQVGLLKIVQMLRSKNIHEISDKDIHDITNIAKAWKTKQIKKILECRNVIKLIKLGNFSGILGYEYSSGMRVYEELIQVTRFFGISWIYHSNYVANNEINEKHTHEIRNLLKISHDDEFIIIGGSETNISITTKYLIKRINQLKETIPAETRIATKDGTTLFMRPKSGSDRMYPETDLPPIIITEKEIDNAEHNKSSSWEETIKSIQKKYELNYQLAEQIFDSEYFELFTNLCANKKLSPNFVSSSLCSTITKLQREGLDPTNLSYTEIVNTFNLLSEDRITNESVEIIFRGLMSQKLKTAYDHVHNVSKISDGQINSILDELINNNKNFIYTEKQRSINKLMGLAMKELRGKVKGKKINLLLQKKILIVLQNN